MENIILCGIVCLLLVFMTIEGPRSFRCRGLEPRLNDSKDNKDMRRPTNAL